MKKLKSVREQSIDERNKSEYFLKNKLQGAKGGDFALVMMEIHNPNKFAIRFDIDKTMLWYIRYNNITETPHSGIIQPGGFQILTHRFYILTGIGLPQGEPVNVIVNMGNNMGIGNTLPSAITTEKK